jgi:CBS domain-containing protein
MATEGVGSIVVLGPSGRLEGIVTDRDLRERVLAAGRPPETTVASIMSAPVLTISPEASLLEAVLEMTRRDIHHLVVVEAGRVLGIVSSHDLLLLQAAMPLELTRAIQSSRSLDELNPLMPRLVDLTRQLFGEGVSGYEIGRIVSEVNDTVIRRVLALTERDLRDQALGAPPVPFVWLVLGSEGRREQTIRTDQDNALVYDDPGGFEGGASEYFARFASQAIDALVRLGYPPCPAGSMASNPKWCQPLSVWRSYFGDWVSDVTAENLMYFSIYLDFRPVAGEIRLAEALRHEVVSQAEQWRSFPRHLAKIAVSQAPPLGWFGRFVRQRHDGGRGVNLKLGGMLILNNALRAYAVDLGLSETNTIERLEAAARAAGCFTESESADVREAYETIFHLRLGHQLAQIATGAQPDNLVDPYSLSRSEQSRLREAFRAIQRLQGKIEDRYFTEGL